jgi:hypothetical protein
LLRHTKRALSSIRDLTEVVRAKFSDEEFGGYFYRSVSKDIEEANLLLDGFLQYLAVSTSSKKRDTVRKLIEEVLKKYRIQLEEKGIKLSKKYEKDLPETVVPDELLRYVLDSILQYGISTVTPGGDMEFSTKSSRLQKDVSARRGVLRKDERYIEIRLGFTGFKKLGGQFAGSPVFQEEPLSLILLRLVKEVLRKNQGVMKFEKDEKEERISISLWFPSERREIVCYQPINQLIN